MPVIDCEQSLFCSKICEWEWYVSIKEATPQAASFVSTRLLIVYAGFSIEGSTQRLIAAYFVFKSLFFALFWHLWLCWRASYFISDHLLLKNLLRTLICRSTFKEYYSLLLFMSGVCFVLLIFYGICFLFPMFSIPNVDVIQSSDFCWLLS